MIPRVLKCYAPTAEHVLWVSVPWSVQDSCRTLLTFHTVKTYRVTLERSLLAQ